MWLNDIVCLKCVAFLAVTGCNQKQLYPAALETLKWPLKWNLFNKHTIIFSKHTTIFSKNLKSQTASTYNSTSTLSAGQWVLTMQVEVCTKSSDYVMWLTSYLFQVMWLATYIGQPNSAGGINILHLGIARTPQKPVARYVVNLNQFPAHPCYHG